MKLLSKVSMLANNEPRSPCETVLSWSDGTVSTLAGAFKKLVRREDGIWVTVETDCRHPYLYVWNRELGRFCGGNWGPDVKGSYGDGFRNPIN